MQSKRLTRPCDGTFPAPEWSGRHVEQLALHDPSMYDRLLAGYRRLLGMRTEWWQTAAESADERWGACIIAAIVDASSRSATPAAWLAGILDFEPSPCPRTRSMILREARSRFYRIVQAA